MRRLFARNVDGGKALKISSGAERIVRVALESGCTMTTQILIPWLAARRSGSQLEKLCSILAGVERRRLRGRVLSKWLSRISPSMLTKS
jgi:hypothetical protein